MFAYSFSRDDQRMLKVNPGTNRFKQLLVAAWVLETVLLDKTVLPVGYD